VVVRREGERINGYRRERVLKEEGTGFLEDLSILRILK